jgi:HAE1 family hydrophobic/amphiphilic exporter-1
VNISAVFIKRPVMTTMLMSALVVFGIAAYFNLPVSELPNVDFPTISVSADLPGADPQTMAAAVATPLERQFSAIPGVTSMDSTSTTGSTRITLQFDLDRNIDAAAQDVQTAISQSVRRLPNNMPSPPSLRKVNPSDFAIIYLALSADQLPLTRLDEYAETRVAQQISTIPGVAQVLVFGSQKYAVRLRMNRTHWRRAICRWARCNRRFRAATPIFPPARSTAVCAAIQFRPRGSCRTLPPTTGW